MNDRKQISKQQETASQECLLCKYVSYYYYYYYFIIIILIVVIILILIMISYEIIL
jgi:hypothetical protein